MTRYIVNLTNALIGKHRWDWIKLQRHRGKPTKEQFIKMIANTLEMEDVHDMNPETLGRILCSLETGDAMVSKEELFRGMHFAGDTGDMLRELVSLCLAIVIYDRLDPAMADSHIPPYGKQAATAK